MKDSKNQEARAMGLLSGLSAFLGGAIMAIGLIPGILLATGLAIMLIATRG